MGLIDAREVHGGRGQPQGPVHTDHLHAKCLLVLDTAPGYSTSPQPFYRPQKTGRASSVSSKSRGT